MPTIISLDRGLHKQQIKLFTVFIM